MLDFEKFTVLFARLQKIMDETPENLVDIKLSEEKWSLKEIAGHLIDSASNNHQRVTRLMLGNLDNFPAYGLDWVTIEKTNGMDWELLKNLWVSYNRFFLELARNVPESAYPNTWSIDGKQLSLDFIISDYYRHLGTHTEHFLERLEEVSKARD